MNEEELIRLTPYMIPAFLLVVGGGVILAVWLYLRRLLMDDYVAWMKFFKMVKPT